VCTASRGIGSSNAVGVWLLQTMEKFVQELATPGPNVDIMLWYKIKDERELRAKAYCQLQEDRLASYQHAQFMRATSGKTS